MGKIRFAKKEDSAQLCELYRHYVYNTTFTLALVHQTADEFAEQIEELSKKYPYLVYEEEGEILGYAYAHPVRSRGGFNYTAETSIYVKNGIQHGGIGSGLYEKLIALLKAQNYIKLYAVLCTPNQPSHSFHQKQGFADVANFPQIGYKFGKWLDVLHMEKQINEVVPVPKDIIDITDLDKKIVAEIMGENS